MQTTDCRVAIEHLLAYWENPDLHRAEAEAALGHIGKCPHCERRMGYLVRALTADEEDLMTCQECQDLLPEYLQAEAEGQTDEAQWHLMALHLETCPHCSAEYATLSELLELAHGERGEEPSRYPVPDLSFLRRAKNRPPQPVSIPWRLNELGHLIIEFSAEVLRAFQLPAYQPAYAVAGLKAKSPRTLCRISMKEAVEDTEVTITAEETRDDPTRCMVTVRVNIPSRGGWPNLAGTEVILKRDELQLDTQTADAYGEAVFEGIATDDLAHLVFEIVPHR
jgi:predicted SprT family Zn-dependent metalloprotease